MRAYYRYQLHVEVPATDAAVLIDALEGEPFGLRTRLGRDELNRQIAELELSVDETSEERWQDFEGDIQILSVYLSETIEGRELHADVDGAEPRVEAWKILGHRGEVIRLRLDVAWDADSRTFLDRGEDVQDAIRRWQTLPEWIRAALRTRHARLSAL
jgi:hypothetical protein